MRRRAVRIFLLVLLAGAGSVSAGEAWHHYGRPWDLKTFVLAGRAASTGANPYGISDYDPNMNAPASLLIFRWLADVEIDSAFTAWWTVSLVLYALLILTLLRAYPGQLSPLRLFWLLCLTSFWHTLMLGQIYVVMGLLVVATWLLLRSDRPVPAGLLLGGLAAIKPTFGFWALALWLAGHQRAAGAAMTSALGLSLLAGLIHGPGVWLQWFEAVPRSGPGIGMPTNASLVAVAARWGLPWLGYSLAAMLGTVVLCWAWRRRPAVLRASAVALVAMVLIGPIGWVDYALWLLPVFVAGPWPPLFAMAATILAIPTVVVWSLSHASPVLMGLIGLTYPLAFASILIELFRHERLTDPRDASWERRRARATRSVRLTAVAQLSST